jgi:hypothetical protein
VQLKYKPISLYNLYWRYLVYRLISHYLLLSPYKEKEKKFIFIFNVKTHWFGELEHELPKTKSLISKTEVNW